MQRNPCLDFFEKHASHSDRVKELQKQQDRVLWESMPASRFSPGPVREEEVVCRVAFNPIYWDQETASLKPTFFDDASNKGASVERLVLKRRATVWRTANRMAFEYNTRNPRKDPRSVARLVPLDVSAIRRIMIGDRRGVGIYDTALADNRAHADICIVEPGRLAFRSARSQLFGLASDRQLWGSSEVGVYARLLAWLDSAWMQLRRFISRS